MSGGDAVVHGGGRVCDWWKLNRPFADQEREVGELLEWVSDRSVCLGKE